MVKIGICGTHCSGKTTLAQDLALHIPLPLIEEVAGTFTEKERMCIPTQYRILYHQVTREASLSSFISDRTVIDNYAYCMFHTDCSPDVAAVAFLECHLGERPYDLVIFVDEFFPLEDNGIRNLDAGQQAWIFFFVRRAAREMCRAHDIPLLPVRGERGDRVSAILTHPVVRGVGALPQSPSQSSPQSSPQSPLP